jgi:simple sugar transport system permease protein
MGLLSAYKPAPRPGSATIVPDNWRKTLAYPGAGAVGAATVMFLVFALTTNQFLTAGVWSSILSLTSELGVVAVGGTLLMIAGEFDLSVGSVFGLSAVVALELMNAGWPTPIAIIVTLLAMAAIGAAQGLLVTKMGIPSLIVTLGGLDLWRGVVLQITGGFEVNVNNPSSLNVFAASWDQFYVSILWFLGILIVSQFVLFRTRFGNWISAAGGNRQAAGALGVPVPRVKLILFILTATMAGLGGIIQMARFGSVDSLLGQDYELQVILAVVVGGTVLYGGRGSLIGTAMGCLMLGMLQQGLILQNISSNWYEAMTGLLLIVAVFINVLVARRAET